MIRITIRRLFEMAGGELLAGDPSGEIHGVGTDTRADLSGRLFVPLIGERFDAHEFLSQAVAQGAAAALWQKKRPLPAGLAAGFPVIGVDDTLAALQKLARSYRRTLPVTVVGVTGSNGKTSTKDLIASVLAERFQVQKTQGNLNNHIGLPLTVLELDGDTDVAVLEMGMSGLGEIALLADIAAPEIGVITNIGEAHIGFLGSRARIADAKFELIESLPKSGLALLFGDEPLLRGMREKIPCRVQWFGFSEANDIRAVGIRPLGLEGTAFQLAGEDFEYKIPVPGIHQVGNALAAVGVARRLGMNRKEIADGLSKAVLSAMRMEVKARPAGGYVINDAYNASPTSVKAALRMLSETPDADFKVAVLGDMLELGTVSQSMHREIGQLAAGLRIDLLVVVGRYAADIAAGARAGGMGEERIVIAESKREAIECVNRRIAARRQPVILVKASRGMKMDEVVSGLLA